MVIMIHRCVGCERITFTTKTRIHFPLNADLTQTHQTLYWVHNNTLLILLFLERKSVGKTGIWFRLVSQSAFQSSPKINGEFTGLTGPLCFISPRVKDFPLMQIMARPCFHSLLWFSLVKATPPWLLRPPSVFSIWNQCGEKESKSPQPCIIPWWLL